MKMDDLHLADDGFGNLLELCGSWYQDNPDAPVPAGMIRGNYAAALAFVFDLWHQTPYYGNKAVETSPGVWSQRLRTQRSVYA